ncbi:MAG TPA: 16S rRNA (adenine(1518)-N(6)/adenine(1519)-N(6))-dimethyltransferase RsmA [Candidatus Saccharimonadales bacterium]|nr:16S rRNA (adenine(1518)-N(6)/adenine(1519)-N(6))-dimethyltransferase RsmA [Candidatus Saccharimonadales bacterium]
MDASPPTKKSLGQHWLDDDASLQAMCDAVELSAADTVLEIGPGPGALTAQLVQSAQQVIAVELDPVLARELPRRVPTGNLTVVHEDILRFDLGILPPGYKVAANIPYYLTSNVLRLLCESRNPFSRAALLVQKEVAERVCAPAGQMSLLSVSVQFYCEARLGRVVPAALFTPPPKVDSQILILHRRLQPLADVSTKLFFRLVKAGFSQRRKTLVNSLGAGLHMDREAITSLLVQAGIAPNTRAQSLTLEQWVQLYNTMPWDKM